MARLDHHNGVATKGTEKQNPAITVKGKNQHRDEHMCKVSLTCEQRTDTPTKIQEKQDGTEMAGRRRGNMCFLLPVQETG
jgi:hypothetical protein